MTSWTPAAVAGIITAITGLVTAIGAVVVGLRAHGRITQLQGQQSDTGTTPAGKTGP